MGRQDIEWAAPVRERASLRDWLTHGAAPAAVRPATEGRTMLRAIAVLLILAAAAGILLNVHHTPF